tara:strand:+ start:108 stop:422 length:315 start_codon:yes stop_codon:yes gene_type:complete
MIRNWSGSSVLTVKPLPTNLWSDEMSLNPKQTKLLYNTEVEAREWTKNSSRYCFEIDVEHELRMIGQENIISKNAGYSESLKLMWYWRPLADKILKEWKEQNEV